MACPSRYSATDSRARGLGGVIGALLAGALPMRRDVAWMGFAGIVSGPLTAVLGLWAIQGFARLPGSLLP